MTQRRRNSYGDCRCTQQGPPHRPQHSEQLRHSVEPTVQAIYYFFCWVEHGWTRQNSLRVHNSTAAGRPCCAIAADSAKLELIWPYDLHLIRSGQRSAFPSPILHPLAHSRGMTLRWARWALATYQKRKEATPLLSFSSWGGSPTSNHPWRGNYSNSLECTCQTCGDVRT